MMMMSSLKLVLIFGAALGLYQFNAQNTNYLASVVPQYNTNNTDQLTTPTRPNPEFDYFLFVLQWPAAFCNIQRSYKQRQQCYPDDVLPNKFTVHGLWPQLNDARSPLFCTRTKLEPLRDLKEIEHDLLKYWPYLFDAKNLTANQEFWIKQWNRHGTCSSYTPQEYLKTVRNLARDYAEPIFDKLQRKGIIPDGTTVRQVKDLREIVQEITGSYPILNIVLNRDGDHLLLEIKLCVKNDGKTLMNYCDEAYKFAAPTNNKESLSPVLDAAAKR